MQVHTSVRAPYRPDVEFVERKGPGHPDSLSDRSAETLANRLARHFLAETGTLRHFNVDKALFASGSVEVGFGGGRVIRPARLVVAGKVDLREAPPDPAELEAGLEAELHRLLPAARERAFDVEVWLSPSSVDLAPLVSGRHVPRANDTSLAVVSWPRSPLEQAVHAVSDALAGPRFRATVPIGPDIKVMGRRIGDDVGMTVAAATIAEAISDRATYDDTVEAVAAEASRVAADVLSRPVKVAVNQASDVPYLTLSGSSVEAGDDGQVGRGNRFGGLITPHRPMSLEACAGKHPSAHVGKVYHAAAFDLAQALLEVGAGEATVMLLSRIGASITEPDTVAVQTVQPLSAHLVAELARTVLVDWEARTRRLVEGAYELF